MASGMTGKTPSFGSMTGKTPPTSGGMTGKTPSFGGMTGKMPGGGSFVAAPAPHHSFLGGLVHDVTSLPSDVNKAGHWVAGKTSLAGRDILGTPGGIWDLVSSDLQAVSDDLHGRNKQANLAFWHDLGQGHVLRAFGEYKKPGVTPAAQRAVGAAEGFVSSSKTALEHPLRDPFATAMTVLPLLHGIGKAADIGSGGRIMGTERLITARPGAEPVPLKASLNPAVRMVQHMHDRIIQRALNDFPESRLAKYGRSRVHGSIKESLRASERANVAPASVIEAAGRSLGPNRVRARTKIGVSRLESPVPRKLQEAALRLTSENNTAEEAAAYHRGQAAANVSPKQNLRMAALYDRVAAARLLNPRNEEGFVTVNGDLHPNLAKVDALVAHGQAMVDQFARDYGLMTDAQLQARLDAPARIRNGARYVEPTAARQGAPSAALVRQRAQVARLQGLHDRAVGRAGQAARIRVRAKPELEAVGTRVVGKGKFYPAQGAVRAERLGAALSVAKDRLAQMEAAAAKRVQPTGLVGGEGAFPGRGFVTHRAWLPKKVSTAAASAPGPYIGRVRSFIPGARFRGTGLEHGLVPDETTRLVAQHMRSAAKYVNSQEFRDAIARTGGDTKRSHNDVLLLKPGEGKPLSVAERQKLGITDKQSTLNQLPEGDEVHGFAGFLRHLVPGLADNFSWDEQAPLGTTAKEGHVWVDRNMLGDLGRLPGPGRSDPLLRGFDNVNSAITAATVYFKLGHIPTRYVTNAVTNMIQGSAHPAEIAKAVALWRQLSAEERMRALGLSGQHGYQALPIGEGRGLLSTGISTAARGGANWWAKHADAPFRFNSISYEARKLGYDTPVKFKEFMRLARTNGKGVEPKQWARIDGALKRANRENIAYDRLSSVERNWLARAFWFYPWTAGATRWAVNMALEHPYKTAALTALGVHGRQQQLAELGLTPSYAAGLFRVGGSDWAPRVADVSTLLPWSTAGQLAQGPKYETLDQFLNPATSALFQAALRQNQYGQHTNHPLTSALAALTAPTPETQVLNAYLQRHADQSSRMYHKTPWNVLARALFGTWLPRNYNPAAGASAYAREQSGR